MTLTGSVAEVSWLDTVLGRLRLTSLAGDLVRIELRPTTVGPDCPRCPDRDEGRGAAGTEALSVWLERHGLPARIVPTPRPSRAVVDALERYLDGRCRSLKLPIRLLGTPFQRRAWEALRAIPYGEVRTYGEIAKRIGMPGASRAVGTACGANPLPLVVPCHRVVATGGRSGGFGGGLDLKRRLLEIEGVRPEW